MCVSDGDFGISPERNPVDREFRCPQCNHALRFRDEAQVLIDEYGDGAQLDLTELVDRADFGRLSIYHIGSQGPVRNRLRKLAGYQESRYEPDLPTGEPLADGFRNEDVQRLTFPDESFDLIISNHVMEHVPNPWLAFAEFRRVLRPGGRMVHSIPTTFPLPSSSAVRAEVVDGVVVHRQEARYHKSPEGIPALVFTDFGADLRGRLSAAGFDAVVRRPHLQVAHARRNAVLVARRVDGRVNGEERRTDGDDA